MLAIGAFILFLIVCIIHFIQGDTLGGIAYAGFAAFALSHVWDRAIRV